MEGWCYKVEVRERELEGLAAKLELKENLAAKPVKSCIVSPVKIEEPESSAELEKLKEISRASQKCLASVTRQQEQSRGKKRSRSTCFSSSKQGQHTTKFHRTAEASPSPYKSPSFPQVYLPQKASKRWLFFANSTFGEHWQVDDMAADSAEVEDLHLWGVEMNNMTELNPHFGATDEVDPRFGVHNLPLYEFHALP